MKNDVRVDTVSVYVLRSGLDDVPWINLRQAGWASAFSRGVGCECSRAATRIGMRRDGGVDVEVAAAIGDACGPGSAILLSARVVL